MSHRKYNTALLARIRLAQSSKEIEELLDKGRGYEQASEPTRRRWMRAAESRREQLDAENAR